MDHVKCLIIGSGPAGYTAAIYASRANLSPVEYCGLQPGGQLTQTTEVENFPGYPQGVDGNQMMMDLREQAERFGTDIRDGEIVRVDFSQRPYKAWDDAGRELDAETCAKHADREADAGDERGLVDVLLHHAPREGRRHAEEEDGERKGPADGERAHADSLRDERLEGRPAVDRADGAMDQKRRDGRTHPFVVEHD